MLLAVDIGNSQITFGVHGDRRNDMLSPTSEEPNRGGWLASWRLPSDREQTSDELAVQLEALFAIDRIEPSEITDCAMSSVVPSLSSVVAESVQRVVGIKPLIVGPGIKTGIEIRYSPASSLGTDRLVDAVAAVDRVGAPAIVVDFGTATTFNVVDKNRRFMGGAIAPGVKVAVSALADAGAKLSHIDLAPGHAPPPLIGRSTEDSMRSGIIYGYAELVAGLLARLIDERKEADGRPPVVVATGGMSYAIAHYVDYFDLIVPDLILDGLRIIAELNPRD